VDGELMRICNEVVKKRRTLTPETDLHELVRATVTQCLLEFEGMPDEIEIALRSHDEIDVEMDNA
jgi:hypothetical protein